MPIAKFEMPDGRVARFEVPEGTTPEQAQAQIQQILAAQGQQQAADVPQPEQPQQEEFTPEAPSFMASVGRGMTDVGQGVQQMGRQGYEGGQLETLERFAAGEADEGELRRAFPGAEARAYVEGIPLAQAAYMQLQDTAQGNQQWMQERQQELESYERGAEQAPVSSFVGRTLGNIAAVPIPGAAQGAALPARAALSSAAGGATAGLEFVPEGRSRLENVAAGAAFGAGGEAAGSLVQRGARGVGRAMRGDVGSQQQRRIMELGEQFGVPVHYEDIGGRRAQTVSTAAERIPVVGTAGGKQEQAAQLRRAADETMEKFQPDTAAPFDEALTEAQQRQLVKLRGIANRQYDRVAELAGDTPAPRRNFNQAIENVTEGEQELGSLADTGLLQELQRWRDAPEGDFRMGQRILSRLRSAKRQAQKGESAVVGDEAVAALTKLENALFDDLEQAAKDAGPGAFKQWRQADTFYRNRIAEPFKKTRLKNILQAGQEPEKAWKFLVQSGGNRTRSKLFYNTLDQKGRGLVKSGLVRDAYEKGLNPDGSFSPAKFAKSLEDRQAIVDEFFKGADKRHIEGLTTLMRTLERAGQVMENPPTGSRALSDAITLGAGAGLFYSPGLVGSVLGSAAAVKGAFQTKTGRNLLLSLADAEPGSERAQKLSEKLFKFMASRGPAAAQAQPEAATTQESQQGRGQAAQSRGEML